MISAPDRQRAVELIDEARAAGARLALISPGKDVDNCALAELKSMKLDHIVLYLSDLNRCLPFYDRLLPLLGFEKTRDDVFVNADAIHFDLRQASEPEHGYHRYAPRLNHLAFTANSREQIEATAAAMSASGFEVPAIQEFSDGAALFLRDLDGMRVELGVSG